jgi:hypothetical protein
MNNFVYNKLSFDRYQVKDTNNNIFGELLMDIDGLFRFFFPMDVIYDSTKGINQNQLEEIVYKLKTLNNETSNI